MSMEPKPDRERETERDIEKLLRASAKRRQAEAGGPFELHAADRRLLQDDVKKQFGAEAKSGSRPSSLIERIARFQPRFPLAVVLVLVLVLGPTLWKHFS